VEEFVDDLIEDRQRAIARERGFAIKGHSLILFGACERSECPYRRE
jgi:Fur family ferric uptake transcriptional regulator